ncbi:MAG: HyaD/HybD family hydrogenase maturation endopeptidase [Desulfobulbaceae bacterium]|nr:HyaD/HybD family hydrogenase maturation endopeptidase [Desulfobulbaceae bacterium]
MVEKQAGEQRIVVLGVGNLLMGDEGAGVRAVTELSRRYEMPPQVAVIDGGTMGIELLPWLDGCSHLLIVDAMQGEGVAGDCRRIAIDSPPSFFRNRSSPHQIGLADVLALAAMTDALPGAVTLLGIIPQRMDSGLELSGPVAAGMERLITMLVDELAGLGAPLVERVVVSA